MSLPIKARVMCDFLGCDPKELERLESDVYHWCGLYYEIKTDAAARKAHATSTSLSHYISYSYQNNIYHIRELGEKSAVRRKYEKRV